MRRVMKSPLISKELGGLPMIEEAASIDEIKEAVPRIRSTHNHSC